MISNITEKKRDITLAIGDDPETYVRITLFAVFKNKKIL